MAKKELFLMICPRVLLRTSEQDIMYSHRFSRDSRQGTSKSTSGAQSEQGSSRPQASGGGGWGRPNGDNHPQASGGGGWGRPPSSFNRPAAGGGGWGRPPSQPNFSIVLIAALLLLPGVTQAIADEFTKDYVQKNQVVTPHTQDDIDHAIEAFNRQHPQKAPAPPEGYTAEYVSHCFHEKYELPENLRETFDEVVQSYLAKNTKSFAMKLETAVNRALLQIHESFTKENGGPIPEKANRDRKEISDVEQFHRNLRAILVSYDLASEAYVDQFLADYFRKNPSDLIFPLIDQETGENQRLTHSSLYTQRHNNHAVFSFFTRVDIIQCVTRKLQLSPQGQIPISSLHRYYKKLIIAATDGHCGVVPNGFLIILPPDALRSKFLELLSDSLITSKYQSKPLIIPLISTEVNQGSLCLIMPNKVFCRTDSDHAKGPMFYRPEGNSQYNPSSRKFGFRLGMGDKPLCWEERGIPCSYFPANMKAPMTDFCEIAKQWGGVPLVVVNDTAHDLMPEESDELSAQEPSSSAYAAAAP